MNFNITKKLGVLTIIIVFATSNIKAQEGDFAELLRAGSEDASTLMGNYLNPVFTGFGYGLANGWYNTAKAHKPLGFDLTFTMNTAFVPDEDFFFEIIEDEYSDGFSLVDPNNSTTSTLFGDETTTTIASTYTETVDGQEYTVTNEFETPEGVSQFTSEFNGIVPMPMVQLGIGLIKNTDLKVRWMPTLTNELYGGNTVEISMFGLGLMHDFKQWIPAIKHIPIDMSVLVAYNRFNLDMGLVGETSPDGVENQKGAVGINSWTYQLLVSKKFSVLTVYGGFGFNDTYSNLSVTGDYQVNDDRGDGEPLILTDPIDETFLSKGMRGSLGMRLKLAFFTIHGDYTFQRYNTLTVGIGFSVR